MDFTQDWSMAVTVEIQRQRAEGSNLATCGTGSNSFILKVQGAPVCNANYGSYNSTADSLFETDTRFNSNTWRAHTDNSRLVWVYTAAPRYLQHFISYDLASCQR